MIEIRRYIVFIVGVLLALLGFTALAVSQSTFAEERMVPDVSPRFSTTVNVPCHESSFTSVPQEVFSMNISLDEFTCYAIVFTNSDFRIDTVILTGPNGDIPIVDREFSFNTTVRGIYALSVAGHYTLLAIDLGDLPPPPLPPNSPYPQHATRTRHSPEVEPDTTVDVAIFKLVEKMENIHPYGLLFPLGVGLLIAGVIIPAIFSTRFPWTVHSN